jgi:DnaJ-class molecular chaperone
MAYHLTTSCWRCGGTGQVIGGFPEAEIPCVECDGDGTRKTYGISGI